ncbi:MAG: urease accessory protein UreE [Gammaproteobacteria bacterium]|nr:urease accessory protein UreE [Gammaproteobacteria bacterium]MDE0412173.1 urease accessory protein UreE [Gammaproteobacteria bacterium]
MIHITEILGHVHDSNLSGKLHDLSHRNEVEYIILDRSNLRRRRFRAKTDQGTDCAVSISRLTKLTNGAVLLLESNRAIVVKMSEEQWLRLRPRDISCAIEIGYFAGNMHWRVRFEKECLSIAVESPEEIYLERLKDFFTTGKIRRIDHDE